MKFVSFCLFVPFVLTTVLQIGCLSVNVMDSAEKLVEAKDYNGAIKVYQNIVVTKPGTSDARAAQLAIGEIYIKHIDQLEHGIQVYEAVIADAPTSDEAAVAHYRLGLQAYRQRDFDQAQTRFEIIVNQFLQLELAHNAQLLLAKSYENVEKYKQAVEVYNTFVQQNPQSKRTPQALATKARILRQHLEDDEEAIRTLELLVRKYYNTESAESYNKEAKTVLTEFNLSPFGFGQYPNVPADFPFRELVLDWDKVTLEHELLARVCIKLWKQGIQTTGAGFGSNGLVYPSIPGVIYVTWTTVEDNDPEFAGRRYPSQIMGDPDTSKKWESLYLIDRMLERTDITPDEIDESGTKVYVYPNGTKVYEYPDGGIDPYEFLGLTK